MKSSSINKILKNYRTHNSDGMASILVTLILVLVISLIVLGFSQIGRHDQRRSADNQLSTQAFYAAESGVNMAISALQNGYLTNYNNSGKTACGADGAGVSPLGGTSPLTTTAYDLDPSTNVQVTCLLINPYPGALQYTDISTNSSTVIPINAVEKSGLTYNSVPLSSLSLNYQLSSTTSNTNFSGCPGTSANPDDLLTYPHWNTSGSPCTAGVLRLDIFPTSILNQANARTALQKQTLTIFIVPVSGAANTPGTMSYDPDTPSACPSTGFNSTCSGSGQGSVVYANCNTGNTTAATPTYACQFQLNFGGTTFPSNYYMRLRSIYENSEVTIGGKDTATPSNPVLFNGGQAIIDSTGIAQDVLRRVQVRAPLVGSSSATPDFALQSTDSVCKLLEVGVGTTVDPSIPAGDNATACNVLAQ